MNVEDLHTGHLLPHFLLPFMKIHFTREVHIYKGVGVKQVYDEVFCTPAKPSVLEKAQPGKPAFHQHPGKVFKGDGIAFLLKYKVIQKGQGHTTRKW